MTKKIALPLLLFALTSLFILPGCRKFIDYIEHHPGKDPRNVKILQLVYRAGDTLNFTYNSHGELVRGIRKPYADDGRENWWFYYDHLGRISSMYSTIRDTVNSDGTVNGFGNLGHKFTYDKWNRIVVDTFYFGPFLDHSRLVLFHGGTTFSKVAYDNQNRVIADTVFLLNSNRTYVFQEILHYNYDANGNRIWSDQPYVYDNKVNPHMTNNSFWAFIDRDYSVNNRTPATEYSSYGLPTRQIAIWRFLHTGGTFDIKYDKN